MLPLLFFAAYDGFFRRCAFSLCCCMNNTAIDAMPLPLLCFSLCCHAALARCHARAGMPCYDYAVLRWRAIRAVYALMLPMRYDASYYFSVADYY